MRWLPAVPLHPAHPPAVRIAAPLAAFQDDTDYYALRFEGTGRLYGQGALRLRRSLGARMREGSHARASAYTFHAHQIALTLSMRRTV